MSAKPKCPKCGGSKLAIRAAYDRTVQTEVHCGTVDGFVVFKGCGWSKKISDPAIIRLAVGKPETCKWEHSGEGDYISPHAAFMPWFPFCPHCGKPVEVVG